ncbi:bifunctional diguanylate cyclase/phosphodiesterase [Neptunicella marina]|uniref:EAL domain-containing protein n=1 Tax=Neptunicella marina TaxID=2125989 RepID=A0A8J6M116_9ALTE|nr:EAL domain-containing protein [Neptunicella marina]MBC3767529.1 EAL domain-containing protein [Neptunicella marina]
MSQNEYENDELVFFEEDDAPPQNPVSKDVWNLLIVDDDEEIHSVTKLALSDLEVNGRRLKFHHAYSGAESLELLKTMGNDIAIILLDVVMETDDAGLVIAKTLREELKLEEPRIILRTGQPGYAPEEKIIKEYDINDYKTKTELTRSKLVTTIIASIRAYQHIQSINQSRTGLNQIIKSASNLLEEHSVKGYCEGVVTQISSLMGLKADSIVCARAGSMLDKDDNGVYVLGAAGEYASYINQKLENMHDGNIVYHVIQCLLRKEHIYTEDFTVLYMCSSGYEAAVFVAIGSEKIDDVHRQLLEVFLSSVSVGYENVNLFHELRTAAYRDYLTKLPNRNQFINRLDNLDEKMQATGQMVVALVDINHFADINDGLGQEVGNQILISVADLLNEKLSEKVEKGRIGADVYGLVGLENEVNPKYLNDIFKQHFTAGEHRLLLTVTMGLTRVPIDTESTGLDFLKQANIALNRAKRNSASNFEYYIGEMEDQTFWRLAMMRQLRTDFSERRLQLWYQPQISLKTEQIIGMEALLRWPTKDGGFISPAVFVPLAEYTGLIVEIGLWVLEEACIRLKNLKEAGIDGLRIAVNISVPQFRDPNFVSKVKKVITQTGIVPSQIELEITESVAMDEPNIVVQALKELKDFGVSIAIDDFGTGFSSMCYLQQLPLDRLKVDRAFVKDVCEQRSSFFAETIVTLGKKLGLETIAEGIETKEQMSYMQSIGCDEAQGYLYAQPMPYEDLVTFIKEYQTSDFF